MRLINADYLLKKCIEGDGNDEFTVGYNFAVREISVNITFAPTIEAEPVRHGRWKKKNGEIYCTNCKKSKWSESFELMLRGFDYCPKCGARMDGKKVL